MVGSLTQSGFSDVKVMPGSFYVRAKDQSGNPVSMFITPNSMEEVTTITDSNDNHVALNNVSDRSDDSMFTSIPKSDELGSKVIGLDVYNHDNKNIGTIKDIAIGDNGQINGYILSVGGFLGIDNHYVAVRPSAIDLSYNSSNNKWQAKMDANAGQLKSAPEFSYSGKT